MALLRSVATVGGYTMMSRVLGFVRDMLTAALLGAGPVTDAFFVALRLPNLFRSLFAEGAFSAAFVPLFAGMVAKEGRRAARPLRRGRARRAVERALRLRAAGRGGDAVAAARAGAGLRRGAGEIRAHRRV